MAEQDDAQQGEGKQEEHRASAADGLIAGRDAAVRAMGLSNSLRGTLSLAELVQRDLAPYAAIGESAQKWLAAQDAIGVGAIVAADEWRREQERLSVGAEIRRLQLDSIDNMGIGRELMASAMESISSMAGLSQSAFADLAQEISRANELAARQMAALMPAVDTSAFRAALGAIETPEPAWLSEIRSLNWLPAEPRPAAPARPQPAPQPPRPQPPAPASPILRLKSELQRLSPDEVAISEALEMVAMLADLMHGSGERLPYASKPEKQQEAIAVYEHYLRHKRSNTDVGIAALFSMPYTTWRERRDAGKILSTLQFAKTRQKTRQ